MKHLVLSALMSAALALCPLSLAAQTTVQVDVDGVEAGVDLESPLTQTTASLIAQASISVQAPPAAVSSDSALGLTLSALGVSLLDIGSVDVAADVQIPAPTSGEVSVTGAEVLGDGPATFTADSIVASVDIGGSCGEGLSLDVSVELTNGEISTLLGPVVQIDGLVAADTEVFNDLGVQVIANERVIVQTGNSLSVVVRPVVIRLAGAVVGEVELNGTFSLGEIRATVECDEQLASSDLSITAHTTDTTVVPGGPVAIDFLVENTGPDATDTAQVSFSLPEGLDDVQLSPSQGTCTASSCQVTDLISGESWSIDLGATVAIDAQGTIVVRATVTGSSADPNAGNDDAEVVMATDRDGDGIPDASDNCPDTFNPGQTDSDGDGIGDACEVPTDTDDDGIPDDEDNCPFTFNPDQADSDGDGLGDRCDPGGDDPGDDPDGDDVPTDEDNCPDIPNPGQQDSDGDGIGNACDELPGDDDPDGDGDGIPDAEDICPRVYDPSQADSDGDGLGDACDETVGLGGEPACPTIHQGPELLLYDGRFRVIARWRTDTDTGLGNAVRLTQESGYFTFFDPGNIELVVKVLDACDFNHRFWISIAGLTDVEVDVTVVDTATGALWTYGNEFKNLFDTTIDVEALATCLK